MTANEYWYFRFTRQFITDRSIQNMKHFPVVGYHFIVIYMELCSLSLPTGGYIQIPKNASERGYVIDLAKDIGEDPELTANAISYLKNAGLVEITDYPEEVEMFIPVVDNNIGKSSVAADRQRIRDREKRLLKSNQRRLLQTQKETYKSYGVYRNVFLTEIEYNDLACHCTKLKDVINVISISRMNEIKNDGKDHDRCVDYAKSIGDYKEGVEDGNNRNR